MVGAVVFGAIRAPRSHPSDAERIPRVGIVHDIGKEPAQLADGSVPVVGGTAHLRQGSDEAGRETAGRFSMCGSGGVTGHVDLGGPQNHDQVLDGGQSRHEATVLALAGLRRIAVFVAHLATLSLMRELAKGFAHPGSGAPR